MLVALMITLLAGTLLKAPAADAADEPEQTFTTENFSITWVTDPNSANAPDLSDADSDGIPDAVERMINAFELARAFAVGELGFKPPPVTGLYPLYIAAGTNRGYAQAAPGGSGRSKPSFIVIPPHNVQADVSDSHMKEFAVHEFHHAIQIGYDADESHWIEEATSAWIEDAFIDDADPNHHLLRWFVPFPRLELTTVDGAHEYGAFIFLQFLTERYGDGSGHLVRELWEKMAVPEAVPGARNLDPLAAIEELLAERGVSFADAWRDFLLWNWRLAKYEEGASYRATINAIEILKWPEPLRKDFVGAESCRLTTDELSGQGLQPLSGDYVRIKPNDSAPSRTQALVTVEGPPGSTGFALHKPIGAPAQEFPLAFNSEGLESLTLPFGRRDTRQVTLGLGNSSKSGPPTTIAYSLRLPGRETVSAQAPTGPPVTDYGTAVGLSGTVLCNGQPAAAADVVLNQQEVVSGTQSTVVGSTDSAGRWAFSVAPAANSTYHVEVDDPLLSSAVSPDKTVAVRVVITIVPERDVVGVGEPFDVSGQLFPAHPGASLVVEFRRPERAWQVGAETVADASGAYRTQIVLPRQGIWELRARVLATNDMDHLPGVSGGRLVEASND